MKRILLLTGLVFFLLQTEKPLAASALSSDVSNKAAELTTEVKTSLSKQQLRKSKRLEKRMQRLEKKLKKRQLKKKREGSISLAGIGIATTIIGGLLIWAGVATWPWGVLLAILGGAIAIVGLLLWGILGGIRVDTD